ncbi:glycoside hydrolase [Actinoplanes sp. KI2]|uniref:sialidase family protein n=1 Tax=Actinoplanes sp. KI2 TaxID=2983315 RepID=UPI0021D59C1D|nr:sialidase family protein [Actinoplanes sp. KI2]MCU7727777.1 glycoside hydrolase [Actinoplanes sp. KI2]
MTGIDAYWGVLMRTVRRAIISGGFSISVILALAPAASAAQAGVAQAGVAQAGVAQAGVAQAKPVVLTVGQAASQDVPPAAGSEPDTLVEPDAAADPEHPGVAVVVGHDGRYSDGGAVGITHAWTRDGGRTWRHAPVPFITTAAGGAWDRASDPVLAFGPGGVLYLSTIAFNSSATDCRSVVLVSRSTDGGATFEPPSTAQSTNDCTIFNDKNWLTVDDNARSPYRGRVYQFWSYFVGDFAKQQVRWSDDRGRTWSAAVVVTPDATDTQASQALVHLDGSITDVYLDYTGTGRTPDREREQAEARADAAAAEPGVPLRARTSHDGGRTWSGAVTVTTDVGGDVPGVRCCLPSAVIDPVTGRMHAVWQSTDLSLLQESSSPDGVHWSAPVTVNPDRTATTQVINADVAAYAGRVLVSYGVRDSAVADGRYVRQRAAFSYDAGRSFPGRVRLGPISDLTYAAQAGGAFPGDYIGTAVSRGLFYAAWPVSSKPPYGGTYHQVLYAAAIRP